MFPTLVATLHFKACFSFLTRLAIQRTRMNIPLIFCELNWEPRVVLLHFMVTIKKLMAPKIIWSINRVLFSLKIGERFKRHHKKTKSFWCEVNSNCRVMSSGWKQKRLGKDIIEETSSSGDFNAKPHMSVIATGKTRHKTRQATVRSDRWALFFNDSHILRKPLWWLTTTATNYFLIIKHPQSSNKIFTLHNAHWLMTS